MTSSKEGIIPMQPNFTLHFRVTKQCNASCTYCSSSNATTRQTIELDKLPVLLNNLRRYWSLIRVNPRRVTVEYVGGEISTLDIHFIRHLVLSVREFFAQFDVEVYDGLQTNLITNTSKLENLYQLFNGRIGTSIDNITDQRRIGTSSKRYSLSVSRSLTYVKSSHNKTLPAVITVTNTNIDRILEELCLAQRDGRNVYFRPIFKGINPAQSLSAPKLLQAYLSLFSAWCYGPKIIVEPFYSLLQKFIGNHCDSYCNWQCDCISTSLNVEPNGDMYLCQSVADMKKGKLGNLIDGALFDQTRATIQLRKVLAFRHCGACQYWSICQGGCAAHSLESDDSFLAKDPYCEVWMGLFNRFTIESNDHYERLTEWLSGIGEEN